MTPGKLPIPVTGGSVQVENNLAIGDFSVIASIKRKGRRFRRLSRVNLKCSHAVTAAQSRTVKRIIIDVQPTLNSHPPLAWIGA